METPINKAPASAETSIVSANDLKVVGASSNPRVRVGFNNKGTINLDELERLPKIEFNDAEFSHFDWLDLKAIDLNSSNWKNIGIRDTDDEADRIESFRVSFDNLGYDMSEFPPCIDTDGDVMEGRTRIKAAIIDEYRYMPVGVYTRSDKSERNTVTNGLLANQKKPVYMTRFMDYVAAGVNLIGKGELVATSTAVDNWLNHEVNIGKVMSNNGGRVTKIRNKILSLSKVDEGLVWSLTKSEAEKWITAHLGLAKADFVLINMADNETYAERAWRHVRESLKNGREPVNLIFYTTDKSPTAARSSLKKSMKYVEDLYLDSWEVVMSQLPAGISLSIPTKRPFIFMGALPQIVQSHKINGSNLVSVAKY
jgi:hypothetical protein